MRFIGILLACLRPSKLAAEKLPRSTQIRNPSLRFNEKKLCLLASMLFNEMRVMVRLCVLEGAGMRSTQIYRNKNERKIMKITYLGTGAAEGAPAVFCNCEVCQELRRRGMEEFHTRAQFLIDDNVGIDFPPDAYAHALRFQKDLSKLRYLLVTHSHMDHFYAHDFILRGYKYCSPLSAPLTIYGNAEVKKVYEESTRRELRAEVRENIRVQEVTSFTPFSFGEGGEYTAIPLPAQHSQTETAFVYLLEKDGKRYLHLTDTGRLPMQTLGFLEEYFQDKPCVDLVTFDCTFLFRTAGEISRHMGLEDNKATQTEFEKRGIAGGRTRYAITHYSHNNAPLKENLSRAEREYGYFPTYDGTVIEF